MALDIPVRWDPNRETDKATLEIRKMARAIRQSKRDAADWSLVMSAMNQDVLPKTTSIAKKAAAEVKHVGKGGMDASQGLAMFKKAGEALQGPLGGMIGRLGTVGELFGALGPAGLAVGAAVGGLAVYGVALVAVSAKLVDMVLSADDALKRLEAFGEVDGIHQFSQQAKDDIEGLSASVDAFGVLWDEVTVLVGQQYGHYVGPVLKDMVALGLLAVDALVQATEQQIETIDALVSMADAATGGALSFAHLTVASSEYGRQAESLTSMLSANTEALRDHNKAIEDAVRLQRELTEGAKDVGLAAEEAAEAVERAITEIAKQEAEKRVRLWRAAEKRRLEAASETRRALLELSHAQSEDELEALRQADLERQERLERRRNTEAEAWFDQMDREKELAEFQAQRAAAEREANQQALDDYTKLAGAAFSFADAVADAAGASFATKKALAITESIIQGLLAVAEASPNPVLMAAAGLSAAGVTARIAAQQPPSFPFGGLVPAGLSSMGASSPDHSLIQASAGEFVVPRGAVSRNRQLLEDMKAGRDVRPGPLYVVNEYDHRTFNAFGRDNTRLQRSPLRESLRKRKVGHRGS